jgi:SnoaL-like protein
MDQLERLIAIEEIKQMKARYFRCVDTKDWQGFADVFTPDAEFHSTWVSNADGGIIRGNQEIANIIGGQMEDLLSVHHGYMPEIDVTSSTTASGVWAMEDYLKRAGGEGVRRSGGSGTWSMHGFGHYHEIYEKVDGEWRIASLKVTRIRLE